MRGPWLIATLSACITTRATHLERRKLTPPSKDNGVGRIIGGQPADPTRYPYMVYLSGTAICAGTLIAPDVILSAAHCFGENARVTYALIGDYNLESPVEDSEEHLFQEVVTHPRYYQPVENFFPDEHDYALIKIYDTATVGSLMKLNKDPSVPDSTPDVPLHILGWGITDTLDSDSMSDVLKEADVSFVPNDVCSQVEAIDQGSLYSLENMVFNITLCAGDFQDGEDTCGGDSGGPILLKGENADDDVQLGITSYGARECGHPEIPAVYARVSYVYDWIRENVCRMSLDPPADFDCDPNAASTEPDLSGEMVDVTLEFVTDAYAHDAGWIVQSPNENGVMVTYANEQIGTYPAGVDTTDTFTLNAAFSLPNNRYYLLTMLDIFGDGLTGGEFPFEVTLSTAESIVLDEAVVYENYTISFEFVLGALPTASPTVTPAPTATMPPSSAPTIVPPVIWVVIDFDERPEETGWRIEAMYHNGESETLKEVYPGTYNGLTSISEPVSLLSETPLDYRFTLTDNEADGICCELGQGSYEVWLGEPDTGEILASGQDLVWEISHDFVISMTSNGEYTSETVFTVPQSSPADRCRVGFAALSVILSSLLVLVLC